MTTETDKKWSQFRNGLILVVGSEIIQIDCFGSESMGCLIVDWSCYRVVLQLNITVDRKHGVLIYFLKQCCTKR